MSWDDVERVASRFEGRLRDAFLAAVKAAGGRVPLGTLADAVESGFPAVVRVLSSVKVPEAELRRVADVLSDAMSAGAKVSAAAVSFAFDVPDERASRWVFRTVDEQGFLRFGVDSEWRSRVAEIIRQAHLGGGHPYETARLIRDGLGLDARSLGVLERFEAGLRAEGVSGDAFVRQSNRLMDRLLRRRAETIARTETLRAARQGRQEAWDQAMQDGILEPDRTLKEWIAVGDACDVCLELQAMGPIPFNDSFGVDEGSAHPNCRCSIGLSFKD